MTSPPLTRCQPAINDAKFGCVGAGLLPGQRGA